MKEGTRKQLNHQLDQIIRATELEHEVMVMRQSRHRFPRRPHHPRYVDVAECFAGSMNFTRRATLNGLVAMEPGDVELGNFDYRKKADRDIAVAGFRRH